MEKKIYAVDIETQGLNRFSDNILQLSIVDDKLNTIYNSYFCPDKKAWNVEATKNGITYDMVKNKPKLVDEKEKIINILKQADIIVTFNGDHFDLPFIEYRVGYKNKAESFDVMQEALKQFALYKHFMMRPSLALTCEWFGITNYKAHDSEADAKATMQIYLKMQEELQKPELIDIYEFSDGKKIYTKALAYKYAGQSGASIVKTVYLENGKLVENPDMSKYRINNFIKKSK